MSGLKYNKIVADETASFMRDITGKYSAFAFRGPRSVDEISNVFKDNFFALLEINGYHSIELFAHEHAIAKSTLSYYLRGKRLPSLEILLKIAKGFEVDPLVLLMLPERSGRKNT